jgi:hypothetical protein
MMQRCSVCRAVFELDGPPVSEYIVPDHVARDENGNIAVYAAPPGVQCYGSRRPGIALGRTTDSLSHAPSRNRGGREATVAARASTHTIPAARPVTNE